MLVDLLLVLVGLLLPWQCEGCVRASLSRTVALGAQRAGLQLVAFAVPYRPNRFYYRLALARTY